jgi:hypothetical protein
MKISAEQVEALAPLFGQRATCFLVGSIYADGDGWSLMVHAIPHERRLAVRAACNGSLTFPRNRKPKSPAKPAEPAAA